MRLATAFRSRALSGEAILSLMLSQWETTKKRRKRMNNKNLVVEIILPSETEEIKYMAHWS